MKILRDFWDSPEAQTVLDDEEVTGHGAQLPCGRFDSDPRNHVLFVFDDAMLTNPKDKVLTN